MDGKTIILNSKEFVFMAALLGESTVLGVDDPFLGWLAEQVEEEWQRLCPEMLKNGLIYAGTDGICGVGSEIDCYIRLCCSPDIWVSVAAFRQNEGNSSFVLNLGAREKRAVRIVKRHEENGNLEICYGCYEQKESIEILSALGIGKNFENKGAGFDIPEKIFKTFSGSSVEEDISRLKDIIWDNNPELRHFLTDMKYPKAKLLINIGSMKAVSSGMTSFVLIEGEDSLWVVDYRDDKECPLISVMQSDADGVANKLDNITRLYL